MQLDYQWVDTSGFIVSRVYFNGVIFEDTKDTERGGWISFMYFYNFINQKNYSSMHNVIIKIKATRAYTINKKYTKIFTWKSKQEKTTECFSYIKQDYIQYIYQHQLEGSTNSLDFLAPTERSIQPPEV